MLQTLVSPIFRQINLIITSRGQINVTFIANIEGCQNLKSLQGSTEMKSNDIPD